MNVMTQAEGKMSKEALKITPNEELPPGRLRVTVADIGRVKERFIKDNLLLSLEEVGAILGKSPRVIHELVKDGFLILADGKAVKPGRRGAVATAGAKVTAASVEEYRRSIEVPPEKWGE
jgi:hypothetical protein